MTRTAMVGVYNTHSTTALQRTVFTINVHVYSRTFVGIPNFLSRQMSLSLRNATFAACNSSSNSSVSISVVPTQVRNLSADSTCSAFIINCQFSLLRDANYHPLRFATYVESPTYFSNTEWRLWVLVLPLYCFYLLSANNCSVCASTMFAV